jgi:hypothetical protein
VKSNWSVASLGAADFLLLNRLLGSSKLTVSVPQLDILFYGHSQNISIGLRFAPRFSKEKLRPVATQNKKTPEGVSMFWATS